MKGLSSRSIMVGQARVGGRLIRVLQARWVGG